MATSWTDIDLLLSEWRARGRLTETGGAPEESIAQVEAELGVTFPPSFRAFLLRYGAGGPVGSDWCGIPWGDTLDDSDGTVLGATQRARAEGLPHHFVVCRGPMEDGEMLCIDLSRTEGGDSPVVFFDGPMLGREGWATKSSQRAASFIELMHDELKVA